MAKKNEGGKKKSAKKSTSKKQAKKPASKPRAKQVVKRDKFASNYNAVRSLLWKEHKKDWLAQGKTYREFIASGGLVSQVYQRCKVVETTKVKGKDNKLRKKKQTITSDCTPEEILQIYGQVTGVAIPPTPRIPKEYQEPMPFWGLDTDMNFDIIPNYVTIISPMLMDAPAEFLPQQYVYEDTFQPFVEYCNELLNSEEWSDSDDAPNVRMGLPQYNERKNRWEVEVYSCDKDGNRVNYGFVPNQDLPKSLQDTPDMVAPEPPSLEDIEQIEKAGEPTPRPKKKEAPSTISEQVAIQREIRKQKELDREIAKYKAESEATRLQTITKYMEMLDRKLITKKKFQELMDKLD